jgi:hypothetical protein
MPFYGRLPVDTGHLTTHQHGAYLLIMHYCWGQARRTMIYDSNITRVPPLLEQNPMRACALLLLENGRWYHPGSSANSLKHLTEKTLRPLVPSTRRRRGVGMSVMPGAIVTNAHHSHSHIKTMIMIVRSVPMPRGPRLCIARAARIPAGDEQRAPCCPAIEHRQQPCGRARHEHEAGKAERSRFLARPQRPVAMVAVINAPLALATTVETSILAHKTDMPGCGSPPDCFSPAVRGASS